MSLDKLSQCRADQFGILEKYTRYLKPGGRLVYATCSMEPEENEEVIEAFLREFTNFGRMADDIHLYPHQTGTDGFFIAQLIKSK